MAFKRGDYVHKKSGAFWEGDVVGEYSTDQTVDGVAVRLFGWPDGPVQIYPAAALEHCDHSNRRMPPAPSSHVGGPVDFAKLYTHPLAKQFHEAIQAVDNLGCNSTSAVDELHALAKAVEQEINRLSTPPDGDVTDDMLNEGQERMCQMASRTVFEDHIQAEIYKAMRAVDPAFRTTKVAELRLFGHWSKHKLADAVFLPLVCYVPTGPDYTTVPLYAPATPAPQPREAGR
jgi:hypothetical protein